MSRHRRLLAIAWPVALALLFTSSALVAQLSTRATITGTVTDGTGAVVPGAKVTITDDSTKVATQAETLKKASYGKDARLRLLGKRLRRFPLCHSSDDEVIS